MIGRSSRGASGSCSSTCAAMLCTGTPHHHQPHEFIHHPSSTPPSAAVVPRAGLSGATPLPPFFGISLIGAEQTGAFHTPCTTTITTWDGDYGHFNQRLFDHFLFLFLSWEATTSISSVTTKFRHIFLERDFSHTLYNYEASATASYCKPGRRYPSNPLGNENDRISFSLGICNGVWGGRSDLGVLVFS